jgi:hypothetical protein
MKNAIIRVAATLAVAAGTFFPKTKAQDAGPIGKTDIGAYILEAPGLPASIDEAARRIYGSNVLQPDLQAEEKFYRPFIEKVESRQKEYQDFYGGKVQKYTSTLDQASMQQHYAAEANKNPIVAGMGGTEAVMKMDDKEREVAARKAAEYAADPFAANGIESAGMTALYQKIVSDPEYAARFNKMSEKEKEAELRKYMANDQVKAKTPAQMQQEQQRREQQMAEADKVRNAMEIRQALTDFHNKLSEVRVKFSTMVEEINQSPGNHADIAKVHGEKYEKIPEVELGEYGHDKDPEQVKRLEIETYTNHRAQAVKNLRQYAPLLEELRNQYRAIVSEYLLFLGENRDKINTDVTDYLNSTYTEQEVATFEAGLLGLAADLTETSKQLTKEIAGWEQQYRQKLSSYGVK